MPHTTRQALRYSREAMERFAKLADVGEHESAYGELVKARRLLGDAEIAWVVAMRDDGYSWPAIARVIDRTMPTAWERYNEDVNDYLVDRERERHERASRRA